MPSDYGDQMMESRHEEMMEGDDDVSQTTEIPAGLVDGEPKPGDTITLTVVSVAPDSGTITVSKSAVAEEPEGGSDAMAEEFNQPQ